jgi:hypothetical protein
MTGTIVGARTWTEDTVRLLGMTTDIETAGEILGIGRTKAYALAKAGAFPAKIIRVGRLYKVSVPALLSLLGIRPGGIAERSAPESLTELGASSPVRAG